MHDAALPARRPLRAPRANGTALVEPDFSEIGRLVDQNVQRRQRYDYDFGGRSIASLTEQAREEVYRAARDYVVSYGGPAAEAARGAERLILAGHQPQMFHPGVWFKNFALDHIAQQCGATAINLIIDSDTLKSPALRVPAGDPANPWIELVPFDDPLPGVAYEMRPVINAATFAAFGGRVREQLAALVPRPLIATYWPLVERRAAATGNLGAALAQARHLLETEWGARTLELPQGQVCDTESFRWFAAHLMSELPRFIEVHNGAVHEFRRAHRIRNAAQPVPDLAIDGAWHEAPCWIWTQANPRRRRFFVRRHAERLQLCDCEGLKLDLPLLAGDLRPTVDKLGELSRAGVKIRSRALITTLWARLVLGDLFIHGIGGANYDQVTDMLIERFFGVAPPGLTVVSATLHLPVTHPLAATDDLRAIRRQLRELEFHPEANGDAPRDTDARREWTELVALKRRWIDTPPTRANAKERCRAIRTANAALQPLLAPARERLLALAQEVRRAGAVARVLAGREYAFCLFPAATLQETLSGLLPKNV